MSNWLRELWRRLRFFIQRQQFERDLEEEMQLHKELRQEEYRNMGIDQDSAQHKANRQFGNVTLLMEVSREMWGWRSIENLLQDLRYGLRMLRRSPGFAAAVVFSLALGIGANTAIFTLINALLLRVLPVRDPHQLVWLEKANLESSGQPSLPYPFYRDLRDHNQVFSGVVCYSNMAPGLRVYAGAERVSGELVSGNYFTALGVKPYIGRLLTPDDDKVPGAERVAVLSYGFWDRRFGADPGIVGKVLHLNNVPMTVIGVTPPAFHGLNVGSSVDIRVPMMMQAEMWGAESILESRGDWWLNVVGRLGPGATRTQAEAALLPMLIGYMRANQEAHPTEYQRRVFASTRVLLRPMARGEQGLGRRFGQSLYVLMAVVGAVLLIAGVNIANLLLARSAARKREIAIRLAIGAGRGRLIRQMLTESLLIATLGGMLGIGLAYWGMRILISYLGAAPSSVDLTPDLHVLCFTFVISILTGILFGLAPALQSTRVSVSPELKRARIVVGPNAPAARKTSGQCAGGFVASAANGRRLVRAEPI